jgi:hypothetical protein
VLVTGCLSEWLQGEISSTPPESCKKFAKLDIEIAGIQNLHSADIFPKAMSLYLLYRRHTLDRCRHSKVLQLLNTIGVTL